MRRVKVKRRALLDDFAERLEGELRKKVEREFEEKLEGLQNAYRAVSLANERLLEERKMLNEQLCEVIKERNRLKEELQDDIPF